MSDLISRKDLCEYALNQKDKSITPNDIMRFPSAEPERKKGQWLENGKPTESMYGVYCSECGEYSEYRGLFCMECGAEMQGEAEWRKRMEMRYGAEEE